MEIWYTRYRATRHLCIVFPFYQADPWFLLVKIVLFGFGKASLPVWMSGFFLRLKLPLDGECTQTIVHPAISVWAVSTMPNGDIVSGCSDGVVRVFSESEERWASVQDLKEYEHKVAGQALSSQQVGDVKKSDLPGPEALNAPGTSFSRYDLTFLTYVYVQERSREMSRWSGTALSWRLIRYADAKSIQEESTKPSFSGIAWIWRGRKSVMSLTLWVRDESSSTREENMTMYLMLTFKTGCLPWNSHIMSQVSNNVVFD